MEHKIRWWPVPTLENELRDQIAMLDDAIDTLEDRLDIHMKQQEELKRELDKLEGNI